MGCGASTAAPPPTIVQHVPEAAAAATPTTPSRGTDAAQAVPTLTPREEIEAFLHEHALHKAPTWEALLDALVAQADSVADLRLLTAEEVDELTGSIGTKPMNVRKLKKALGLPVESSPARLQRQPSNVVPAPPAPGEAAPGGTSRAGSRPGSARPRSKADAPKSEEARLAAETSKQEARRLADLAKTPLAKAGDAVDFYFVRASKLRELTPAPGEALPSLRTLLKRRGWIVRLPITLVGACHGLYVSKFMAVSHRWETQGQPDQKGEQLKAVKEHLEEHAEVEFVWYDYWCMFQNEPDAPRAGFEDVEFKSMLYEVNRLYLGCSVLILMDMAYMSRFWTQFEAWLSMQRATPHGLEAAVDAADGGERATIKLLHTAKQMTSLKAELKKMWGVTARMIGEGENREHSVVAALSSVDIEVTNKSDKKHQLAKIPQLARDVTEEMAREDASKHVERDKAVIGHTQAVYEAEMALADERDKDGGGDTGRVDLLTAARDQAVSMLETACAFVVRTATEALFPTAAHEAHDDEEDEERSKWWVKVRRHDGRVSEVHRFLMCKGVEWGFQYHNFYGDWELSSTDKLCNGRPHYVHNTMYGGHAHLFHTIDPHYHVPRWVIGPAPGDENGWAFCESDAPTPHEVQATWISWDGNEWHSCRSLRFVEPREGDALDDDDDDESIDYEEELALERLFVGDEGQPQPQGAGSSTTDGDGGGGHGRDAAAAPAEGGRAASAGGSMDVVVVRNGARHRGNGRNASRACQIQ